MRHPTITAALAVSAALLAFPEHSPAQGAYASGSYDRMALGLDVVGQLPVGDFAEEAGLGFGGLLRYKIHPFDRSSLGLTLRSGYLWHLEKKTTFTGLTVRTNHSMLPILAGARYTLPRSPIYVAAEAGPVLNMLRTSEDPGGAGTDARWELGWTAGVGYEVGRADLRLGLHFLDASDMGGMAAIGFSVGYNFWGKKRAPERARTRVLPAEAVRDAEPELRRQLLTTGMLLLDAAYFETGKTDISINSEPYLSLIARLLTAYPTLRIEVGGHTDSVGGLEYNRNLSQGRAQAVVNHMLKEEPSLKGRLSAKGYGYSEPKASNATAEGRQLNRRTELKVLNRDALREYR